LSLISISFFLFLVICNKNNTTGVNSGAITTYPTGTTETGVNSGAITTYPTGTTELNPDFNGVRVV